MELSKTLLVKYFILLATAIKIWIFIFIVKVNKYLGKYHYAVGL